MVEVLYGVRPARARTVSAFGVLPAARRPTPRAPGGGPQA
jgi:hypothetical protein